MQKIFPSLYSNFILNLYIVYELNDWPCNPAKIFPLINFLFGTVTLVRKAIKSKFTYNGRVLLFNGKGLSSFDNGSAKNVVIFGVDNISPSQTEH